MKELEVASGNSPAGGFGRYDQACQLPIRIPAVSFLDRLKREAEERRRAEELAARERDAREQLFRGEIEPRVRALIEYLEGLVRTLQELKPDIRASMNIAGYGDLSLQSMWDYRLEHERRYRGFALSMSWTWRIDPERTPPVRAETAQRVKVLLGSFRQYHLGGIKDERRSKTGEIVAATFQARGQVKASFGGQISADDPVLRLLFTNASWLGTSRRQVPWAHVNDELFDKLARFLVREDDALFTEEFGSTADATTDTGSAAGAAEPDPVRAPEPMVQRQPAASPAPPPEPVREPDPPAAPVATIDDVLIAIPDPTAALIAAFGQGEPGLAAEAATPPAYAPIDSPPPPVAPPSPVATRPVALAPASPAPAPPPAPTMPAAPAPVATAPAASVGEEDLEPLTRTEAALFERLRRRLGAPSGPSGPGPAGASTADAQRLDAAAFRQRMNSLKSRLGEDEPGGTSG